MELSAICVIFIRINIIFITSDKIYIPIFAPSDKIKCNIP